MEQVLLEMFEQARKLVVETDRRLAEENDRIQEKEREAKLLELSAQIEAAFDFTSKEKLELDPRLDMQDGKPTVEFIVRSLRAIFVMTPQADGTWCLSALEDGRAPQSLGEFHGGTKSDAASRRLAAARIVTAIGNWSQKGQPVAAKKPAQSENSSRWQDTPVPIEVQGPPRTNLRHHGQISRLLSFRFYRPPPARGMWLKSCISPGASPLRKIQAPCLGLKAFSLKWCKTKKWHPTQAFRQNRGPPASCACWGGKNACT